MFTFQKCTTTSILLLQRLPFEHLEKKKLSRHKIKYIREFYPGLNRSEFLTRIFTRNEAGFCLTGVLKKICVSISKFIPRQRKKEKKRKKRFETKKIFTHIQETKNLTRQTFRSSIRILDVVSTSIEASRGSTRTINFNPLSRM